MQCSNFTLDERRVSYSEISRNGRIAREDSIANGKTQSVTVHKSPSRGE